MFSLPSLSIIPAAACLCLSLITTATPARAQFAVCNQTLDVANVALGQAAGAGFETRGWWVIGTNRCVDVVREPLSSRFFYIYAGDVFGQSILNGTTMMCIGTRRFVAVGTGECWVRGLSAAPFFEVDTQAVERWTLFLRSDAARQGAPSSP